MVISYNITIIVRGFMLIVGRLNFGGMKDYAMGRLAKRRRLLGLFCENRRKKR